jgi:hypothetical protein
VGVPLDVAMAIFADGARRSRQLRERVIIFGA